MDIILYYKEAFNIALEDLEEIRAIDLDHLNLYARHMRYLQVDYNAGIINGESIEKALEVAVISKAKEYYKRLFKNRKKRIINEKIRDETSNPTDIERLTKHGLKKYMTTLKEDDLDKYMENWNENYCINSITLVEEFPRPEIMAYAMKKGFFKDNEIEEIMEGGIDLNSGGIDLNSEYRQNYRQNVLSNFYDFYYKEDLLKRLREELLDPAEY